MVIWQMCCPQIAIRAAQTQTQTQTQTEPVVFRKHGIGYNNIPLNKLPNKE